MEKQEEKSIGELLPDRCENHTDASAQSPVPKDALGGEGGGELKITSFLWVFFPSFLSFVGGTPHGWARRMLSVVRQ